MKEHLYHAEGEAVAWEVIEHAYDITLHRYLPQLPLRTDITYAKVRIGIYLWCVGVHPILRIHSVRPGLYVRADVYHDWHFSGGYIIIVDTDHGGEGFGLWEIIAYLLPWWFVLSEVSPTSFCLEVGLGDEVGGSGEGVHDLR